MGTLVGHVAPGFAFLALGLWHLLNHIKRHSLQPNSYISTPWFPSSKVRYIELYLIMLGSSISIAMELFIGPKKHQPFADGTIPSNHIHNFEHATIALTFFTYAAFAILLDRNHFKRNTRDALTQLLGAIAFAQQLLLFHLHSADHTGVEGQYHLLLQIVILVSLATTLIGIALPGSFLISFVRSASIFFQGAWLILMGYMLWTPEFIPKGCFINFEEGHQVVRCHGEVALHRAKSLVNLEFSWFLVGITIFSVCFYVILGRVIGEKVEYATLSREDEYISDDVESQEDTKYGASKSSFVGAGKEGFVASIDIER
ncbi:transmembrane protein 45B-like [Mangifera indica]|uniref:transmembrane protein 45B-like n=1 Tax=Mangifera indica TaxID=29780 RepID=UPI001CFB84D9|nr:transmembrane protein 45B-like [Mangifera indica]